MTKPGEYLRVVDVPWPRKVTIERLEIDEYGRHLRFFLLLKNEEKPLRLSREQFCQLLTAFQYRGAWPGCELLLAPGGAPGGRKVIIITPVTAPALDVDLIDGPRKAAYLQALYCG